MGETAYAYIHIGDQVEIREAVNALNLPDSTEFQEPERYHITLVYADNLSQEQLADIAREIQPPDFDLTFDGFGIFENGALYLRVVDNPALRTYQEAIYTLFEPYGPVEHSQPPNYTPHLTVAFLPAGSLAPKTTFDLTLPAEITRLAWDSYQKFIEIKRSKGRQMNREFLLKLRKLVQQEIERMGGEPEQDRAVAVGVIREALWDWFYERGYWFMDLYTDDGGSYYAIASREGKLWQHSITLEGSDIVVGEGVEVQHSFEPVQTRAYIHRNADTGETYFTLIAAVAVLNRVAEIDSTRLFDSFIEEAQQTGEYPYLTFYHNKENLRMGVINFLFRDGYTYINAGRFLNDDELPDVELRALRDALIVTLESDNADEWGVSIGYKPYEAPVLEELADGVFIPIYNRGKHVESSILLEAHAASIMTAVTVN